jgi:hypothetical protein
MPIKFRIYYACSLYLLLWSCTTGTLLYFKPLKDDGNHSNASLATTMYVLLVILILKSLLSIKSIQHYKTNTRYSKAGRKLVIAAFILTIIVTLFMSTTAIFMLGDIINNGEDRDSQGHVYINQILFHICFFSAVACSIYLCIFDLILLKAIRKGYYNPMLNFGKDIIEPT